MPSQKYEPSESALRQAKKCGVCGTECSCWTLDRDEGGKILPNGRRPQGTCGFCRIATSFDAALSQPNTVRTPEETP